MRISKTKKRFRKGYMASWSEELFTVGEAHPFDPPVYRLIDGAGTILDGTFYEQELQKVIVSQDKLYRVEAVLQRRKKGKRAEVQVKLSGYPASFNTWIDAKAVVAKTTWGLIDTIYTTHHAHCACSYIVSSTHNYLRHESFTILSRYSFIVS